MLRWSVLSKKNRLLFFVFAAFGCLCIVAAFAGQQSPAAILQQLTIGLVITAVAVNPANYINGIVFNWSTQSAASKFLIFLAGACLVVSMSLKWFA
ncbi:hypothetical protein ACFONG_19405 [Uliginosibacterium paludis]|uniref:Uncharacterized protein n=1 Tax=Uliginosibacterium paludis TaxID=1615952 RepID=A0ABV2CUC6_9RHOO